MQPTPSFAPEAVLATLSEMLGSVADLVIRDGGRRLWIFPIAGETPVHLYLPAEEPDSCDVYAGFAFSATIVARAEGDAGADVSELIREIAAGRLREYFDFGDTPGVHRSRGREFGSSGFHWNRQWTPDSLINHSYTVPAWRHQPTTFGREA